MSRLPCALCVCGVGRQLAAGEVAGRGPSNWRCLQAHCSKPVGANATLPRWWLRRSFGRAGLISSFNDARCASARASTQLAESALHHGVEQRGPWFAHTLI